jgi:hypothetical protein
MNCEYCKSEFKTKSALNNHKNKAKYCLILQGKIEPKEEVFKCNLCDKLLSTKQNLEFHKEKCEGKKEKIEEFQCDYCNKILSSRQGRWRHEQKCKIKNNNIDIKQELDKVKQELAILKETKGNIITTNNNNNTTNNNFNLNVFLDMKFKNTWIPKQYFKTLKIKM